jgi:hypothetical protein
MGRRGTRRSVARKKWVVIDRDDGLYFPFPFFCYTYSSFSFPFQAIALSFVPLLFSILTSITPLAPTPLVVATTLADFVFRADA